MTGIIGISSQLCCLVLAVSPLLLEHIHTIPDIIVVIHILTVGLVASRFGLWLFDLTINQMLQERVAKEAIGKYLEHVVFPAACILRSVVNFT